MNKLFVLLTTLVIALFASAHSAFAQYGQYGQPAPVESILIDKQVSKPVTTSKGGVLQYEYVDNLTPSDVRFQPGMDIYFKLRVKNTSSTSLDNVMVTDKVPWYLNPIEGPGTYDVNARTISFNAGTFASNEEKIFYFKMQWFTQDKLPADRGLMCVSNYARAYTNNASDDDTAQACVEKQVIGVKQAPKAGPEMNIVLVAGQLAMLGLGIKLKKKSV
ncbi:MAG: hypothetical protein NTZ55_00560 [Candidatus Roizmanbacteria bacterium]|nr:hypothetical protein [Candidatus Roizmanbacteria bacterium]